MIQYQDIKYVQQATTMKLILISIISICLTYNIAGASNNFRGAQDSNTVNTYHNHQPKSNQPIYQNNSPQYQQYVPNNQQSFQPQPNQPMYQNNSSQYQQYVPNNQQSFQPQPNQPIYQNNSPQYQQYVPNNQQSFQPQPNQPMYQNNSSQYQQYAPNNQQGVQQPPTVHYHSQGTQGYQHYYPPQQVVPQSYSSNSLPGQYGYGLNNGNGIYNDPFLWNDELSKGVLGLAVTKCSILNNAPDLVEQVRTDIQTYVNIVNSVSIGSKLNTNNSLQIIEKTLETCRQNPDIIYIQALFRSITSLGITNILPGLGLLKQNGSTTTIENSGRHKQTYKTNPNTKPKNIPSAKPSPSNNRVSPSSSGTTRDYDSKNRGGIYTNPNIKKYY